MAMVARLSGRRITNTPNIPLSRNVLDECETETPCRLCRLAALFLPWFGDLHALRGGQLLLPLRRKKYLCMEDAHMSDSDLEKVGEIPLNLEKNSDLCEKLMEEYGESKTQQHRRVCASSSAMRTLLKEEGKPLTPLSYLDATISALCDTLSSSHQTPIDPKSASSLTSFLSTLLPLIPSQSLKANDLVTLLVSLSKKPQSHVTVLNVIRSLGVLIEPCGLEDWSFAKSVFEVILEFSVDKRQEIRECAQVCAEKIYKAAAVEGSGGARVMVEASELFYSMLFYKYLPYAIAAAWSRIEITADSEQARELMLMESVHMLSVLKLIVQYLSSDVVLKVMSEIHKILGSNHSLLTGPNFTLLETILKSPRAEEIIVPKTEIVIFALGNYVSPKENNNNPAETVLFALVLLEMCIDKLHAHKRSIWLINLPLVFEAVAGVVGAGLSVSKEAAGILETLVNRHIDELKTSASDATLPSAERTSTPESKALKSVCAAIDRMQLTLSDGELNEDILSVVKQMFLKLGDLSYFYLKGVVHKLTELLRVANRDSTRTNYQHLESVLAVLGQNPAARGVMNPASMAPTTMQPGLGAFGMGNPMHQNPQGLDQGGPSGQGSC